MIPSTAREPQQLLGFSQDTPSLSSTGSNSHQEGGAHARCSIALYSQKHLLRYRHIRSGWNGTRLTTLERPQTASSDTLLQFPAALSSQSDKLELTIIESHSNSLRFDQLDAGHKYLQFISGILRLENLRHSFLNSSSHAPLFPPYELSDIKKEGGYCSLQATNPIALTHGR